VAMWSIEKPGFLAKFAEIFPDAFSKSASFFRGLNSFKTRNERNL
jgi:hypothetical protein